MAFYPAAAWAYPNDRYYYGWYDTGYQLSPPTDRDIKSIIVDRLKENPYTKDEKIKVDVKRDVVILNGDVSSCRAKRAAGDDAWDTQGVADVSNQLVVLNGHGAETASAT
ncbi:MAG: BON domain-containing protein [Acidimicrobiia bacterium]